VSLAQEASWRVIDYPRFSLWIHAKLSPRASDVSSTRWSPSYGSVVVLEAEANIIQVVLNKGKAINQIKMQQTKFAEK
jgi:hypothetical protein